VCVYIISIFYQPTHGELSRYSVWRLNVDILIVTLSRVSPPIISILCHASHRQLSLYSVARLTVNYVGIFLEFSRCLVKFFLNFLLRRRSIFFFPYVLRQNILIFFFGGVIKFHIELHIFSLGKIQVVLQPGKKR
jgi:hypothetical protein